MQKCWEERPGRTMPGKFQFQATGGATGTAAASSQQAGGSSRADQTHSSRKPADAASAAPAFQGAAAFMQSKPERAFPNTAAGFGMNAANSRSDKDASDSQAPFVFGSAGKASLLP